MDITGPYQVSELPELYARLDLSVQLYPMTGINRNLTPTKFFESLANGVPVICSDMGDLGELIARYPCGVVLGPSAGDVSLASVEEAIGDAQVRARMVGEGLRLVREEYNWEVMRKRLLKAVGHMVGSRV